MLDDIEAREALHVLVLSRLADGTRPDSFVLKGGVNLRLYFESPRYSEDLDLDVDPRAKRQVIAGISDTLSGRWLLDRLRTLGIEGLDYSGKPAKHTDTTVRFRLGVINRGGIRLPTRIELSLRDRFSGDKVVLEDANQAVVKRYLAPAGTQLTIPHYPRDPAIRQKLRALALRSATQARDVADLHVVTQGDARNADTAFLRRALSNADLEEASKRALSVSYSQFQDQVLEFLPEAPRAALDEAAWEERQFLAVELIDAIKRA